MHLFHKELLYRFTGTITLFLLLSHLKFKRGSSADIILEDNMQNLHRCNDLTREISKVVLSEVASLSPLKTRSNPLIGSLSTAAGNFFHKQLRIQGPLPEALAVRCIIWLHKNFIDSGGASNTPLVHNSGNSIKTACHRLIWHDGELIPLLFVAHPFLFYNYVYARGEPHTHHLI